LELEGAELLAVGVDRRPLDFLSAPKHMTYDWTVAPTETNPAPWCWQMTPRLMRAKDLPKPEVGLHQTIPMEILVHKRLVDTVPGLKHKHVRLGPVVASELATDWFQLMTDRTMPPYHEATTGKELYQQEYAPPASPPTLVSKMQEGYWPAYRRVDVLARFGEMPPVAFTHELEGIWGPWIGRTLGLSSGDLKDQVAPPQPRLLVSQQTRHELTASGVKRLTYTPVRWMD